MHVKCLTFVERRQKWWRNSLQQEVWTSQPHMRNYKPLSLQLWMLFKCDEMDGSPNPFLLKVTFFSFSFTSSLLAFKAHHSPISVFFLLCHGIIWLAEVVVKGHRKMIYTILWFLKFVFIGSFKSYLKVHFVITLSPPGGSALPLSVLMLFDVCCCFTFDIFCFCPAATERYSCAWLN